MPGSSPGMTSQAIVLKEFGLALGELEATSRLGPAVLLALDGARIAGQEATLLQHATKLGLEAGERFRDAVADGARLSRQPAPAHGADDVELALALGGDERLLQDHLQHGAREIDRVLLAVDGDLAGAGLHPHAGDSVLALAGRVGAALRIDLLHIDTRRRLALERPEIPKRHRLAHGQALLAFFELRAATSSFAGLCASWGCSGPA